MRILDLRFKNLNSLAGEWRIDLTHPAYLADGIFVITGPTGAGKSTLLDALCLALYGQTPRLGKITGENNEILSRRSAECFAEVTFETPAGRYRCHWSQRRARGRSGGRLQPQKHEIAEADSGRVLDSTLRGVLEQVERLTGLDFHRFTRSMLLAQGAFAAFLQAEPGERAPLLEQITGTEIYSRLSIQVHERCAQEKKALELQESALEGMRLLAPEEEQAARARQEELTRLAAGLDGRMKEQEGAIAWLDELARLEQERGELQARLVELNTRQEAFQPQRVRWRRAMAALELEGDHVRLAGLREDQTGDAARHAAGEAARPGLEAALAQAEVELTRLGEALARCKAEQAEAKPRLQQARALDARLEEKTQPIREQEQALREGELALTRQRKEQETDRQALLTSQTEVARLEQALQSTQADGALVEGFSGIQARLQALGTLERKRQERVQALGATGHGLEGDLSPEGHRIRLEEARTRLEEEREGLTQEIVRLEAGVNQAKKALSLEEERRHLHHGTPCPLCGSPDHPYAEAAPAPPEEAPLAAALARLRQVEADLSGEEARRGVLELTLECQGAGAALEQELRPFGVDRLTPEGLKQVEQTLKERRDKWVKQDKDLTAAQTQCVALKPRLELRAGQVQQAEQALQTRREHLARLRAEREELARQRRELLGELNPDTEERRLTQAVAQAEAQEKMARDLREQAAGSLTQARQKQSELATALAERTPRLAQGEEAFRGRLGAAGFSDEADFLAAQLPEKERGALQRQEAALTTEREGLEARQGENGRRLEETRRKQVTEQPREVLEQELNTLRGARDKVQQESGGVRQKLRDNDALRQEKEAGLAALEGQRREWVRWKNLDELIGSADGGKYRKFAQGLTFEGMIGHANRTLATLTDRYLLVRDAREPLSLNVVDGYQAGEVRSVKNLSGGESFIVSLALALGLSRMAGNTVRVDSLFLDEGFGTLDEEALNTALSTLAGLRQEGKLIGVISHVAALKERIPTQIQVIPKRGGTSILAGPGCSGS